VRPETRHWLKGTHARDEPDVETMPAILAHIEAGLGRCKEQLPGFEAYHLNPGSVRLPWNRLFEVDFDIK
jgi:hypothetical protein